MQTVTEKLDRQAEKQRLGREMEFLQQGSFQYVYREGKIKAINEEEKEEPLEVASAGLSYDVVMLTREREDAPESLFVVFEGDTEVPCLIKHRLYAPENRKLKLVLGISYTKEHSDFQKIDAVGIDLPYAVAKGDRIDALFYLVSSSELKVKLVHKGMSVGECEFTLPESAYVPEEKAPESQKYPDFIEKEFAKANIIGTEQVKEELLKLNEQLKEERLQRNIEGEKHNYNFVLRGNPGTGKNVIAKVIAKILYENGIVKSETLVEADRETLVSDEAGETAKKTESVLAEVIEKHGTLYIDEAFRLYIKGNGKDHGREAIAAISKALEEHSGEFSVIISGAQSKIDEMLEKVNIGFTSKFEYSMDIPDYSSDELMTISELIMQSRSLFMSRAAKRAFADKLEKERSGESFLNVKTVRNILDEAEENKIVRLAELKKKNDYVSPEEFYILDKADFAENETEDKEISLEEKMARLQQMVGLADAKAKIKKIIASTRVVHELIKRGVRNKDEPVIMHMFFSGNEGTGKAAVARLLAGIYKDLEFLSQGQLVECRSEELLKGDVEEASETIRSKFDEAKGGLLFIEDSEPFINAASEEILEIFAENAVEYSADMMIVLSDTLDNLKKLLNEKPVLKKVFANNVNFADYTTAEMVVLAKAFIKAKGYVYDSANDKMLAKLIDKEKSETENFENVKGVRKVVKKLQKAAGARVAQASESDEDSKVSDVRAITGEDILACMM